jgi:HAD superfamily hydrolase (TIGR01459 family)
MSEPESAERAGRPGATRVLSGMAEFMDDIDAFILDQWGVLHDGYSPCDGAVDCLQRIRAAGKGVVILSNSGKRADENIRLIERMGFARDLFDAVISAGDDARDAILHSPDPFYRNLGPRCLAMTRDADLHLADGLGRQLVADVEEADFLLVLSIDAPRQSVAGWEPVLARAAARELPMVCGNPDFVRVAPSGQLFEAPGLLARRYAELGGAVRLHGKPCARIYEACLRLLPYPRERIAVVGDSLHHDVAGAAGVGLRSVFIAGGVHREELGIAVGESPDPARCALLYAQARAVPDVLMPMFRW